MRMLSLLKHFELVFIQVDVELISAKFFLVNQFDGTWHTRSLMLACQDLTECACAQFIE